MAIQVGGTQVISNSQGLTNIASVDSTTAASILQRVLGAVLRSNQLELCQEQRQK